MNRPARIISGNLEYGVRGVELLKQLVLMTSKEKRDYLMGLLVYKRVNGIAPSYSCNVLSPASVQTRESRSSDENILYVPYVNYGPFKQSFEYRAPVLWNSVPGYFRKASSMSDFKRLYKVTLFQMSKVLVMLHVFFLTFYIFLFKRGTWN